MDLQTLLPKSTEVARSKHVESKRPEVSQQQFVTETNRRYARKQQTVGGPVQTRNARIDREKRNTDARQEHPGRGGTGRDHGPEAPPGDESRTPQPDGGRPDGTGRLVNVVISDGWGRV